ncbi:hypothetical protein HK099_008519, partial [Clydaea vesicula]
MVSSDVKQAKIRQKLVADLQIWLGVLLSDEAICENEYFEDFMRPSSLVKSDVVSTSNSSIVSKTFGGIAKLGSVMKKVATDSGKGVISMGVGAVGMVTGESAKPAENGVVPPPQVASTDFTKMMDNLEVPARNSSIQDVVPAFPGNGTFNSTMPDGERRSFTFRSSEDTETSSINNNSVMTPERVSSPQGGLRRRSSDKSTSPERKKVAKPKRVDSLNDKYIENLSKAELEIILECAFGVIEEAFNLSDPEQWIRQKGLHMVKSILRRTYGPAISNFIKKMLIEQKSPENISDHIRNLKNKFWDKDDNFITEVKPPRTETQKEDDKILAKKIFVEGKLFNLDGLVLMVGKGNTTKGLI